MAELTHLGCALIILAMGLALFFGTIAIDGSTRNTQRVAPRLSKEELDYLDSLTDPKTLNKLGGLNAILFKASEKRPGDVIVKLMVDTLASDDSTKSTNPQEFIQHAILRFRQLGWNFFTDYEHNFTVVSRRGVAVPMGLMIRHAA